MGGEWPDLIQCQTRTHAWPTSAQPRPAGTLNCPVQGRRPARSCRHRAGRVPHCPELNRPSLTSHVHHERRIAASLTICIAADSRSLRAHSTPARQLLFLPRDATAKRSAPYYILRQSVLMSVTVYFLICFTTLLIHNSLSLSLR